MAIVVRMGTAKQLPDYRIKEIIIETFLQAGVNNVRFFIEQNDIENTGLTYHVRGGTVGPFALNKKAIEEVVFVAKLANYEHLK